ncbi:YcnI family protein [Roseococcus microcysteis]|uniref:YcnI family protein n=1 Tax=Roseococcus microcysteis TaxID=2771361 RepID=UPI00168A7AF7|nr:YcnI family protein [Roseococcus microcysteis]
MRKLLALLLLASAPAGAHVTIDPPEAAPNSFQRIAFRVPHGCAGQPTTAIEVTLPEGITSARPSPKPGWELTVRMRPLERPVSGGHGLVREAPSFIAWSGGNLPDPFFEEFVMMIRTPNRPGETLLFPVAQLCAGGARHDWVEVATAGQARPRSPAPTLRLGAAP